IGAVAADADDLRAKTQGEEDLGDVGGQGEQAPRNPVQHDTGVMIIHHGDGGGGGLQVRVGGHALWGQEHAERQRDGYAAVTDGRTDTYDDSPQLHREIGGKQTKDPFAAHGQRGGVTTSCSWSHPFRAKVGGTDARGWFSDSRAAKQRGYSSGTVPASHRTCPFNATLAGQRP